MLNVITYLAMHYLHLLQDCELTKLRLTIEALHAQSGIQFDPEGFDSASLKRPTSTPLRGVDNRGMRSTVVTDKTIFFSNIKTILRYKLFNWF